MGSILNKTRTSKVGAISKAQRAQNIFLEKNLKFLNFFCFKKTRIVPKNVKGGPSGFINIHSVAKYQKTRRGDPLGTFKNFRKKVTECQKNPLKRKTRRLKTAFLVECCPNDIM